MSTMLETVDLRVHYGGRPALKGVSLAAEAGQVLAVIGPSGCGKSTLLRAFNRMNELNPDVRLAGDVRFNGRSVYEMDAVTLRRRIGMVFQRPTPFPMSIFDNVAYGPRMHGVRRRDELAGIVERSLRQAALWDEVKDQLTAPASALSGGQQQRLCIARTLAVKPDVILLDEPTSALDPAASARIEELVETLAGHYTIVLVTHNLAQARRLSDRTALLQDGELVETGPTDDFFSRPKDPRSARYLSSGRTSWAGAAPKVRAHRVAAGV